MIKNVQSIHEHWTGALKGILVAFPVVCPSTPIMERVPPEFHTVGSWRLLLDSKGVPVILPVGCPST